MALPKLFIGSSGANVEVAKVLANSLEDVAEVKVWDENVFTMGDGFLEKLVKIVEDYDFAAFIFAADDMTISKDQTQASPRDNVLFETGLFMGLLGRDRVFLVHDKTQNIKIPSDFAGVTLATYDGDRMETDGPSAVRKAVTAIRDRIKACRYPHLLGDWRSEYLATFEDDNPLVRETLSIRSSGDCLYFATKESSVNDFYTVSGRMALERQILGKWKSRVGSNDMDGIFMLTVSPSGDYMYGYFTSPDVNGGIVYATWVLAKTADADEAKIEKRLASARKRLKHATVLSPTQESATG